MNGIEKQIARAVASALIGAGHKVTVDYERGYDSDPDRTDLTDLDKIIAAADAVDECWFLIQRQGSGEHFSYGAFVYFIWANGEEGRTCISDYSLSLEALLEPINEWTENADIQLVGAPARSPATWQQHEAARALPDLNADAPEYDPVFDPALVGIERKRFSTTQGEVAVSYDGKALGQFGDNIVLAGEPAEWQGNPDSYWIDIAERMVKAARLRADAKLLDTGMDPELVRELHAEADALLPQVQS